MTDFKVFNDPIHGNIELKPLLVKIIDTPQFQRLRNLKQLGGKYYVYPGASHNRFEHSIGVCHLAGRLVRALRDKESTKEPSKRVDITALDELCVEIAALCHDLGHGPFSHLFDGHIVPNALKAKAALKEQQDKKDDKKGKDGDDVKEWKHEKVSIKMFHYMVEENQDLKKALDDAGIKDDGKGKHITFITEMIDGNKFVGRPKDTGKSFLYEIVSNERNGIDVDKWDYIARDSYMLGMGNPFNFNRCIAFSRVIEDDGENHICFRDKEATNLYDMFHTRLLLHERAYQHKTGNIIEHMIADALLEADEFITFKGKEKEKEKERKKILCLSETFKDMKAYTFVTDNVVNRVLEMDDDSESSDQDDEKEMNKKDNVEETTSRTKKIEREKKKEKIKKAKSILERVQRRDLYKLLGERKFPSGFFEDKEAVTSDIKKAGKAEFENIDEFGVIDHVKLNYGRKQCNPLDFVKFYSKNSPDEAISRNKDEVSLLLPEKFEEQLVRVYWKEEEPKDLEGLKRAFEDWADTSYAK